MFTSQSVTTSDSQAGKHLEAPEGEIPGVFVPEVGLSHIKV